MDNTDSIENVLTYFDKGFEHWKEYKRICIADNYRYSAPLVSALPEIHKKDLIAFGDDLWSKEFQTYPPHIVERIQMNPKYAECFE